MKYKDVMGKPLEISTGYSANKPPGCSVVDGGLYLNKNINSVTKCGHEGIKCICKENKCNTCPPSTYSDGGLSAQCKPCKKGEWTNGKSGAEKCSTSEITKCKAGEGTKGFTSPPAAKKKCTELVYSKLTCKNRYLNIRALNLQSKKNLVVIPTFSFELPPGCVYDKGELYLNTNWESKTSCGGKGDISCICKEEKCAPCPKNTYSDGGPSAQCKPCKEGEWTMDKTKQIKCVKITCKAGTGVIQGTTEMLRNHKCNVNIYDENKCKTKYMSITGKKKKTQNLCRTLQQSATRVQL
jgi:hypothetical protein